MKFIKLKKFHFNSFIWSEIGLIFLVIILIAASIAVDPSINYIKANRDERISNNVRNEAMSNINTDRESVSENRLVTSHHMQRVATKEAKKEYGVLMQQPRKSKYSFHELSTNGVAPRTKVGRKLNNRSDVRYGENCAEISFGKRTFRNPNHQFQPFKSVRWPWQIANLVNTHFMDYDQANQNIHRNNIMNKHNDTMGISVIYNHKLNRGILVEEFARKDKMYKYMKRPSKAKILKNKQLNHKLFARNKVNNINKNSLK